MMTDTESLIALDDDSALLADRSRQTHELAGIRLISFTALILVAGVLFVTAFFFGFDDTAEQLFIFSVPHLLLVPVANYASLRLGTLLSIALGFAFVQFLLDAVQVGFRIALLELNIADVLFLFVALGILALDVIYAIALWRMRTIDLALNNTIADQDRDEKKLALVNQEANTLRLTAAFAIATLVVLFFFLLIFVLFDGADARLTLLSLGHIVLAPLAAFGATRYRVLNQFFFVLAALQTLVDLFQIVVRVLSISDRGLNSLGLVAIVAISLLLINGAILIIDSMYVLSSVGLELSQNGVAFATRTDTLGVRAADDQDFDGDEDDEPNLQQFSVETRAMARRRRAARKSK